MLTAPLLVVAGHEFWIYRNSITFICTYPAQATGITNMWFSVMVGRVQVYPQTRRPGQGQNTLCVALSSIIRQKVGG